MCLCSCLSTNAPEVRQRCCFISLARPTRQLRPCVETFVMSQRSLTSSERGRRQLSSVCGPAKSEEANSWCGRAASLHRLDPKWCCVQGTSRWNGTTQTLLCGAGWDLAELRSFAVCVSQCVRDCGYFRSSPIRSRLGVWAFKEQLDADPVVL